MAKIQIKNDELVFEGKFIRLIRRHFRGALGKDGIWEIVQRKMHGKIVVVAAVTPRSEVILTKIFRVPLKTYVIELPAGLADRKGEDSSTLARRELLEETGYTAKRFEKLAVGTFDAGLTTDEMVIYLGRDARRVRKPQHENGEDIEVLKVPSRKLAHFLAHPPKDVKVDVKLFGLLYHLKRKGFDV
jgi:ADP-ribose pyrophosphatase